MELQKMQHGYLVLADISGYTSYLAGVELDHAHEVLTDLLETIVRSLKSLLTIAKLEGDAVFAYVPEARVGRGETLLELVEVTYAAFRDRVEGIRRRTTCTCNACRAIPGLDLKFIVHHGNYIVQNVAGISELVGSDVNLVHRLLKNHVGEVTGWRAYALFTGPSLEHLSVPCDPRELHMQTETYEHLGAVETYSLNLQKRYHELEAARRVVVEPAEAHVSMVHEYPARPAIVWDWLNDPQRRFRWMTGTAWTAGVRPGGRTGVGAHNHCAHGKNDTTLEVILDWKPFSYFTVEQAPDPSKALVMTFRLEPLDDGARTRLHTTIMARMKGWPRWASRWFCRLLFGPMGYQKSWDRLAVVLAEEMAREPELAEAPAAAPA